MQFVRETIGSLASGASAAVPELPPATLLVIQSDAYDWKAIFAGARLRDGRAIHVVQLGWDRLLVTADSPAMSARTPCLVHVRPTRDGKGGGTIKPDFVLGELGNAVEYKLRWDQSRLGMVAEAKESRLLE